MNNILILIQMRLEPWRAIITVIFFALFIAFLVIEYKGILGPNEVAPAGWLWFGAVLGMIFAFVVYFTWKYEHNESAACCLAYDRIKARKEASRKRCPCKKN
jgi:hypothetical protein